jgi:hypothetical protein
MKAELYNEILKEIKSFSGSRRKCGKHLQEKFPRYYISRYFFFEVVMKAIFTRCVGVRTSYVRVQYEIENIK